MASLPALSTNKLLLIDVNPTKENDPSIDHIVRTAIQDIAVGPDRGRDISRDAAQKVMHAVLKKQVDEVQVGIFLIALRMKRETLNEFTGLYSALLSETESIVSNVETVVSLADPFDGYLRNVTMTPFIPAVLAANGLHSVIHGVNSVGPKHGVTANKVYKLAGIDTGLSVERAAKKMESVGFCYVDQSLYSPSLYALQDLRHRIVKRSALTTLERLLIPIRGQSHTRLVLGYVHKAYPDIYTRLAFEGGFDHVLLLKGVEGGLAPALNKPLRRFVFDGVCPEDVDSNKSVLDTPFSGSASCAALPMQQDQDMVEQCLERGLEVLKGHSGVARDSLSLACAQILTAYDIQLSFNQALEKVNACLDNGAALERFQAQLQ